MLRHRVRDLALHLCAIRAADVLMPQITMDNLCQYAMDNLVELEGPHLIHGFPGSQPH